MQIDLLYFDDCPSWQGGLENLKAALAAEALAADIRLVKVTDEVEAARLHFLGSPSFRMNGRELWDEARGDYSLSCRLYVTPQGMQGAPTVEMVREKLCSLRSA